MRCQKPFYNAVTDNAVVFVAYGGLVKVRKIFRLVRHREIVGVFAASGNEKSVLSSCGVVRNRLIAKVYSVRVISPIS